MNRHFLRHAGRTALSAGLAVLLLTVPSAHPPKAADSKLKLLPIVSNSRLEDIQESPDGTRLLTHDRLSFVPRLWDPRSMRIVGYLSAKSKGSVRIALMSRDGSQVLTVAGDMARVWSTRDASMRRQWEYKGYLPPDSELKSGAISRDNKLIAVASNDGRIYIAENKNGSELREIKIDGLKSARPEREEKTHNIAFSSDGSMLSVCGTFKDVVVVSTTTLQVVSRIPGLPDGAGWTEFSVDGKQLLVTGLHGKALLWGLESGKVLGEWEHVIGDKGSMPNTLMAATFVGKNFENILVAGSTGTMTLYDRTSLSPVRKLEGYVRAIREIRRSANGLAVGTYADEDDLPDREPLKLWNVETGKEYPFDRDGASPTAGEFSPDGRFFWVGSRDGSIRRHELETGAVRKTTFSQVSALYQVVPLGSGSRWLISGNTLHGTDDSRFAGYSVDFRRPNLTNSFVVQVDTPISSSGELALLDAVAKDPATGKQKDLKAIFNLFTGKSVWGFWDECQGGAWIDGERFVAWDSDSVHLFDLSVPKYVGRLYGPVKSVNTVKVSVNGSWIAVEDGDSTVQTVSIADPSKSFPIGKKTEKLHPRLAVSPNGNKVAYATDQTIELYRPDTGVRVASIPAAKDEVGGETRYRNDEVAFSPDSRFLIVVGPSGMSVYNSESGQFLYEKAFGDHILSGPIGNAMSPDSKFIVYLGTRNLRLFELATGKHIASVTTTDVAQSPRFSPDGKRLLVLDETDQLVIFDTTTVIPSEKPSEPGNLKRVGSLVLMRGDSWLVMDTEGRYDASDPSNVSGAAYVYEWSGGLEPIDVGQMKAQYYEPDLLAKLMGLDTDPVRAVPPLSSLKLYPEVLAESSQQNKNLITVSLTERENGGIGTVNVAINGKVVEERKGAGFFTFDASKYDRYFLPAARLPKGQGNVVSFTATNGRGDLASRPFELDLGIPAGLSTPQVRLFALFVGVGDYAGEKKDLTAPANDASEMARVIQATASALLPSRVFVTKLTTGGDTAKPNRAAILNWFDETAKTCTSSDIVLVYFAGHGTSKIGNEADYFFLTVDADPSDVSPSYVGVSTISGADLQREFKKMAAAKQMIVLDTCHSGAAAGILASDRSTGSDYARAYESIKDATGTWILAGSAADQLSYESANVDHGMLTYALLEGIDQMSPNALRATESGDAYIDVERWFSYAAGRVESLKSEVGIGGIQRPEFKRQSKGTSPEIGVIRANQKGMVGLKPPKPIVILGQFDNDDREDPAGLEGAVQSAFGTTTTLKVWTEVSRHPNVYRIAGSYSGASGTLKVKVSLQRLDGSMNRTTLATFEVSGEKNGLPSLAAQIRAQAETRILEFEEKRKQGGSGLGGAAP